MKKSKKIILRLIPVLLLCLTIVSATCGTVVFADGGVLIEYPEAGDEITNVTSLAKNIWSTVTVVAQIIAFVAIIFAGIRYMFASADAKADIKKQTVILVVGAIFVFGASTVVQLLMNIFNEAADI